MRSIPRRSRIILLAGIFAAASATLISAALLTVLFFTPKGGFSSVRDVVKHVLLMCLFTAIPAGSFGFMSGVAGGAWLSIRSKKFHSKARVIAESVAVGVVMSLIFPTFHWLMGLSGDRSGSFFDTRSAMRQSAIDHNRSARSILECGPPDPPLPCFADDPNCDLPIVLVVIVAVIVACF
jgi:hypothetical protein